MTAMSGLNTFDEAAPAPYTRQRSAGTARPFSACRHRRRLLTACGWRRRAATVVRRLLSGELGQLLLQRLQLLS